MTTRTYKLLLEKQKETGSIIFRLPSVQTCQVKIKSKVSCVFQASTQPRNGVFDGKVCRVRRIRIVFYRVNGSKQEMRNGHMTKG